MVVGATTDTGATFVAKVDGGGPVRVQVQDAGQNQDPVFTSSQAVDAQGVAKVSIAGLAPNTRYLWEVEDNGVIDTSVTGQFLTHPPAGSQASFTIGVGGDAGLDSDFPGSGSELVPDRLSNHPVFDTIRQKALAEDWLFFGHLGDLHYYNLGQTPTFPDSTLANYRAGYDDVLAQPRQARLYREIAWQHVWDDHEFGPNDSDGTHVDKANAAQVYREREPHYPLGESDAIYHSFTVGRVLFIASDVRYYRSPNDDPDDASKTMLGADQKAWMEDLLSSSTAEALVWLMPSQWLGTSSDSWDSFQTERDELASMLADHGWLGRMVMVYADRHAIGIDSGGSNQWGSFPIMQAAALDSRPGDNLSTERFDVVGDQPGREQYGTIEITDIGSVLTIKLTAWRGTTELGSYTKAIATSTTPLAQFTEIADLVHGSHRAVFEARVLTTFQTGDDPDGTTIPILGGDVAYDGTADIFATLSLETEGISAEDRSSLFPRRAADLLAPYGNEAFVRRGIDLGTEILWVPLGYFRLNDAEQNEQSGAPIRLSGQDRMAGIIDARLIDPIQFAAGRTVGSVVAELVTAVYPDAVIAYDDDSDQAQLGRQLIVEESRYKALHDIAQALGKIIFWDGEGILRIIDAPNPSVIAWEVKAGYRGVLVSAGRSVSREGMFNGIVATGEGGDTENPVRGVAVDVGPNSPTRWGGRFGRVPMFYNSPLLTTNLQAAKAARSLLRRHIGMPYQVDFGAVPNPALRPRDVVRVVHKDGSREKHIVESCTIPLSADAEMSATTREQTLISVGEP